MTSLERSATRMLGSLGEVGSISYGQWRSTTDDVTAAQELLETALDAGMNLIDTADVYGLDARGTGFGEVEALLGRVLARAPGLRERMVLGTKGGIRPPVPYDSSDAWLRTACDDSLRRLRVETIDLYQIHRPDMYAHPAEVAATLADLARTGQDPRGRGVEPLRRADRRAPSASSVPDRVDTARVLRGVARSDPRRHAGSLHDDRHGPARLEPAGRRPAGDR